MKTPCFHSVLIACLLAIGISVANGQAPSLKVVDAANQMPLAHANVEFRADFEVEPSSVVLVTNNQGEIDISDCTFCAENKFLVEASYVGYQTKQLMVEGLKNTIIALETAEYMLDEAVVTVQYQPGSTSAQAVHKIRVINAKRIEQMAAVNLEDVLTNELNFQISQDNVLGSSVSLQGLSGENVKIMIDGVPIIGRQNGNLDLNQINLNEIERIEVVEGPLSVNYGPNALAGTINLITRKTSPNPYDLELSSYFENTGTANLQLDGGVNTDKGRFGWSFGRNFFDGWDNEDSFLPRFDRPVADTGRWQQWKPRTQLFARGSYHHNLSDNSSLSYRAEVFDEEITNRGAPRAPFHETAFDDAYLTRRYDQSLLYNGFFDQKHRFKAVAGWNSFRRISNSYVHDLTTLDKELMTTEGAQDTATFVQLMSRGSYSRALAKSKFNYELGYDVNHSMGSGERIEGDNPSITDVAAFATAEWSPVKDLTIRPGVRWSHNSAYDAPIVPSINVRHQMGNWTTRVSYGKGFRAPSLKELYLYFVDVNHNIVGNPDLKAEEADNYSAQLSYQKARTNHVYKASLNAFYNAVDELITLGQITPVEFTYVNVGNYYTQGITADASLITKDWQFNLGGGVTGIATQLGNADEHSGFRYFPEVRGNLTMKLWKEYGIGLFYKYQGEVPGFSLTETNELFQTTIGDFHWADANVNRNFFDNRLNLAVGCKNLLNVRQIAASQAGGGVHAGGGSSVPMGMGRMVFLKVDFKL